MEEKDDNFFNWYRGINMNNHVGRANYNVEYTLLLELISILLLILSLFVNHFLVVLDKFFIFV